MWHNMAMCRLWLSGATLAVLLAAVSSALAAPRLERERCLFKAPRSDRLECYLLVVPENRDKPQGLVTWVNERARRGNRLVGPIAAKSR